MWLLLARLWVLGLELVQAAEGSKETAEGPAESERLETVKSETNDRQGLTVNTGKKFFFSCVSCEVTFRESNLFSLESCPIRAGRDILYGFAKNNLRKRRKKPA